ncbi:MAG: hypothetical protein FJ134_06525 [Deltaproteobacteria bacterium]|nr:hypothetical protein [Deltaproteobacteria bacterium]
MTTSEALKIVQSLAEGQCPFTGQTFPPGSPFQHVDVVRALFIAINALQRLKEREKRNNNLPDRAGKPWNEAEDQELCKEYDSGKSIVALANSHKRTRGAIESRLEKLGKIPPKSRSD